METLFQAPGKDQHNQR